MALRLPKFVASTAARGTGLVRADPRALTDTGNAGFEAVAGAGRALSNIAHMGLGSLIKRKKIDEDLRWGSGTTKTTEFTQGSIRTALETDFTVDEPLPDSDDYLKAPQQLSVEKWDSLVGDAMSDYDKSTSQIRQSFLTEDEKKRYDNFTGSDRLRFQKDISKAYRDKLHAYEEDRLQTLANTAYRNGDIEAGDSYINSMDKNELISPKRATALKAQGKETAITEEITGLYRAGFHDEAKKVLESSSLSSEEKEKLEDVIDQDEKAVVDNFEASVNDTLVQVDNTENMTQAEFNAAAEAEKQKILGFDKIDGTERKRLLTGLEKWRRGTNEIDYAKLNSLNQELDSAQRTGIVDPTIESRIRDANLDGSFGGRFKGGIKTYGDMIRRFERIKFDERVQVIAPIVSSLERVLRDEPDTIFLFNQAKNQILADNPDISARDLFVRISALAESYETIHPALVRFHLRQKKEDKIDIDTARQILLEAGGDKEKARKIARERGLKF